MQTAKSGVPRAESGEPRAKSGVPRAESGEQRAEGQKRAKSCGRRPTGFLLSAFCCSLFVRHSALRSLLSGLFWLSALCSPLFAFGAPLSALGAELISFRDVTKSAGLFEPLLGLMGHGGAWGDFDHDGRIDLYVGGFCDRPNSEYQPAIGPVPNRLFRNLGNGSFAALEQPGLSYFGRTSGAVFADLNNDGWLDLYAANNARTAGGRASGEPQSSAKTIHSKLFRNDRGMLIDVSTASGACPESLNSARNVGVLDYDGDGLLDLFLVEDRFTKNPRSFLLRNKGGFEFEDVTVRVGLPADVFGLGLAVADLNNDGRPDFFVGHSNRLFLSTREAVYRESKELNKVFEWKPLDGEDWPCGACFGDLNRDGNLDLVVAIHSQTARNQVFLNEGLHNGAPRFRNVTLESGLGESIPVRCPHVEIQDFDNDGWPDIYFSAAWIEGDRVIPLIYRNQGLNDGSPQFTAPRPISSDMVYYPAGPTGDYDGDGRLDLFLINWFQGNFSRLLHNESATNQWLDVRLEGQKTNRMGIGATVSVYARGSLGKAPALLGHQEIATGYGYASGQPAVAHFGLGDVTEVDVLIRFPGQEPIRREGIKAGQVLAVQESSDRDADSPTEKKSPARKSASKKGDAKKGEAKKRLSAVGPAAEFPPQPAGGENGTAVVSDESLEFLKRPATLQENAGVAMAKVAPRIDFAYFPGQDYAGKPWSNWGDSVWSNGKYYASIGDHLAPAGNAFVYEYDPQSQRFRELANVRKLLQLPEGHYTPGKIHTQLGIGLDGWLYFATHRGSTRVTTPENHFSGEWILRAKPESGEAQVVVHAPVPMHCIPTGMIDPQRMIFYGATAAGDYSKPDIHFFAYDLRQRKVLCDVPDGPSRAMILSSSSGRVYYAQGRDGDLMRFDPGADQPPKKIANGLSIRAASSETASGIVYFVSYPEQGERATLHTFDTKSEQVQQIGNADVGSQSYITSLDVDATGRYLYYIPGAHGGAEQDGAAVVQYDLQKNSKKVLACLHPFYKEKYGCALVGTYSYALNADGSDLYVTWNANRSGGRAWDTCALTVIHIPQSERP